MRFAVMCSPTISCAVARTVANPLTATQTAASFSTRERQELSRIKNHYTTVQMCEYLICDAFGPDTRAHV